MDAVKRDRSIVGTGTSAQDWRADAGVAALPAAGVDALVPPGARLLVVAPHPDDEILSCGGLLHLLAQRGGGAAAPVVVAVTDGERSHENSPDWPRARLLATRPGETEAALRCLGIAAPQIVRIGIPDGGVRAAEADLVVRLGAIVRAGDVLVTTWRYDGHPDHEATARACAAAAAAGGARVLETPVWGWHWSAPGDGAMPLAQAVRLALPPEAVARKRAAMACFHSQITPDASTGAAPILPAHALARAFNPFEVYFHDCPTA